MIRRLLIANRGEIAVRVARTAREMGIEAIGVYAGPDADAFHVGQMDRAVALGGNRPTETYLSIDRLLEAARTSGADAVHPGYGFLSENADFARAVAKAGLIWVGAPPEAIEEMGDKLRSRQRMEAAGVPVVPGSRPGSTGDAASPTRRAHRFPLSQGVGGRGGKGMSRVDRRRNLGGDRGGPSLAKRRSAIDRLSRGSSRVAATGNSRSSGTRGRVGSLERECSVQRRHQKIVEETPSRRSTPPCSTRWGPGGRGGAGRRYVGAGTVDFLSTRARFYFWRKHRLQSSTDHEETSEAIVRLRSRSRTRRATRILDRRNARAPRPTPSSCGYARTRDFLPRSADPAWREPAGRGFAWMPVSKRALRRVGYDPLSPSSSFRIRPLAPRSRGQAARSRNGSGSASRRTSRFSRRALFADFASGSIRRPRHAPPPRDAARGAGAAWIAAALSAHPATAAGRRARRDPDPWSG